MLAHRRISQRRLAAVGMLVGVTAAVALVVAVTLGAGPGGRAVARAEEQRPAGHAPSKADGHATAREPAFSAPDPVVTVGWVGDTALGSRSAGAPAQGGRALFASVRGLLRRPDILIGNLEGTFGTGGASKCPSGTPNCFAFQAPPATARALSWAGFDVMSLANNHAYDYGASGQRQTIAALDAAGVRHTGLPGQITVVRRDHVRIAIIGFAPYSWASRLDDIPAATALVRRARAEGDVVVVTMHAGAEGADQGHTPRGEEIAFGEHRGHTRAFAHAVVDAGASLVVGSGPHVVRGVERRHGALIIYSTGNFAGYHTFSTEGALGQSAFVVVALTARGRIAGGRWHPIRLVGSGTPVPLADGTGSTVTAARLSAQDFPGHAGLTARGVLVAG